MVVILSVVVNVCLILMVVCVFNDVDLNILIMIKLFGVGW